jgi:hypothetical protein
MVNTFIVDVFKEAIYGPYRNKRKMNRDIKKLREDSDMFLELTTNLFTIHGDTQITFKEFLYFKEFEIFKGVE